MSDLETKFQNENTWPIIEGIVTTQNEDGSVNVAPLGPRVASDWNSFLLRPYPGSRTHENLVQTRKATFHVTDDVLLIAKLVTKTLDAPPATSRWEATDFFPLEDCCRWYAVEVQEIDTSGVPTRMRATTTFHKSVRDYWGLNRAKHAVLEAAILATRVDFLPQAEIEQSLAWLESWVTKTGDVAEQNAWKIVTQYIANHFAKTEK